MTVRPVTVGERARWHVDRIRWIYTRLQRVERVLSLAMGGVREAHEHDDQIDEEIDVIELAQAEVAELWTEAEVAREEAEQVATAVNASPALAAKHVPKLSPRQE